jgi:hypothetical protein
VFPRVIGYCDEKVDTDVLYRVCLLKNWGLDMFKLCVSIMIIVFLAGCGVRYNWVPQSDEPGPPNVDYEGTGISDPNSKL